MSSLSKRIAMVLGIDDDEDYIPSAFTVRDDGMRDMVADTMRSLRPSEREFLMSRFGETPVIVNPIHRVGGSNASLGGFTGKENGKHFVVAERRQPTVDHELGHLLTQSLLEHDFNGLTKKFAEKFNGAQMPRTPFGDNGSYDGLNELLATLYERPRRQPWHREQDNLRNELDLLANFVMRGW